jgi:hypothetical protein
LAQKRPRQHSFTAQLWPWGTHWVVPAEPPECPLPASVPPAPALDGPWPVPSPEEQAVARLTTIEHTAQMRRRIDPSPVSGPDRMVALPARSRQLAPKAGAELDDYGSGGDCGLFGHPIEVARGLDVPVGV